MRVLVIGAGYVGLTTAAVFSRKYKVTLIDKDRARVKAIIEGETPIFEVGLDDLLKQGLKSGRLKAKNRYEVNAHQDLTMICVGTPQNNDGTANLRFIESVVSDLDKNFSSMYNGFATIALRSTVTPGTTRKLILDRLLRTHSQDEFGVIYSPEFLAQGQAIQDIMKPNRIVVGSTNPRATQLYIQAQKSCVTETDFPIYEMSLESAELCKLASNYFLATKISFAGELASLVERVPNADIDDVLEGVTADTRINPSHLRAGLGYGGSCLPKDTSNLLAFGRSLGVELALFESVIQANDNTHYRLVRLLKEHMESISGLKVAILGLSFKAGTDDSRNSPSLELIKRLRKENPEIWVHDPVARLESVPKEIGEMFNFSRELNACTEDADVAFLMTDWEVYKEMGLERLTANMKRKLFIDGRRMFVHSDHPSGIEYFALGSYY